MAERIFLPKISMSTVSVASFVVLAMILGGGGSNNPFAELLLQLCFVVLGGLWFWHCREKLAAIDGVTLAIACLILLLPLAQLVPLPPSIWNSMPGRESEIAALELVGAADAWRPLSMSPTRTLSSALAMIPAVWLFLAISVEQDSGRRIVLLAIVTLAIVNALIGVLQLVSPRSEINLYAYHSVGWVTGFQANRNHAADVLMIGILALGALYAGNWKATNRVFRKIGQRALFVLSVGAGVLLFLAAIMTGSRTGAVLLLLVLGGVGYMMVLRASRRKSYIGVLLFAAGTVLLIAILALLITQGDGVMALSRVLDRFDAGDNPRSLVWADTIYAIKQTWPVGVGLGGFVPAILAAERLEFVDASYPNRAHNEYLELALESGGLGFFVLIVVAALLILQASRSWRAAEDVKTQVVFAISVLLLVGLHSAVDYPLRSMALACLAAVAGGMTVRPGKLGDLKAGRRSAAQ